jgi:hypothetical protein
MPSKTVKRSLSAGSAEAWLAKLRRMPIKQATAVSNAPAIPSADFQMVDVTAAMKHLFDELLEGHNQQIERVWRCENSKLFSEYTAMRAKLPDTDDLLESGNEHFSLIAAQDVAPSINEKLLWHGKREQNIACLVVAVLHTSLL